MAYGSDGIYETNTFLLQTMLGLAVPLEIDRLRDVGGPHWGHWMWARVFSHEIASRGDALFYGGHGPGGIEGEGKGSAARLFTLLARALAIMSFCPGGVRFMADRWETQMPKTKRKEKEPKTSLEIATYLVNHANGRSELIEMVAAAIEYEKINLSDREAQKESYARGLVVTDQPQDGEPS